MTQALALPASAGEIEADEHVFLIGRPPASEFLGFVTSQTTDGITADVGQLMAEWRDANDRIRELETAEAGFANDVPTQELPAELAPLAEAVYADPMFRASYSLVPTDIRVVELDRLVVFQKSINLSFVENIRQRLGPEPPPEAVFRTCLPFDHPVPPARRMRIAQNGFMFASPSTDLRFHEAVLLRPDQLVEYNAHGPLVGVVGLVVGFGSNYLSAVQAEARLILNNGSHRAYALRDLGVTHVPCLVQRVTRREEIEVIGPAAVHQQPDQYLTAPRPPVLKDYFDPRLRKILRVARRDRQVKIGFGVEQVDVPRG